MKKKTNRSILMALIAVMAAAGIMTGCGSKADAAETTTIAIESQETAEERNETIAESEVSVETAAGESGAEQEEVYIDMQPVSKWGHITFVDPDNGRANFDSNEYYEDEDGNYKETVTEIVLHIPESTPILDASTLMPVDLSDIDPESTVYVWTSQAMTMSLPPQTTAQVIIVNVPEDASAPMYVIAKEVSRDGDAVIITDQDGVKWRADADSQVSPYLTRNIVTLEDIEAGTRMIISQDSETSTSGTEKAADADAYAAKIMLFAD